jgi:hypothetical protein
MYLFKGLTLQIFFSKNNMHIQHKPLFLLITYYLNYHEHLLG